MGVSRMSMPNFRYMRSMAGRRFSSVPFPWIRSIIGVSSQTARPPLGVGTPLPRVVHSRMTAAAFTSRVSSGWT